MTLRDFLFLASLSDKEGSGRQKRRQKPLQSVPRAWIADKGEPPVILTCPSTGEQRTLKWFNRDHVQFEGGRSCARRNIRSFYGEAAANTLRALTQPSSIVESGRRG